MYFRALGKEGESERSGGEERESEKKVGDSYSPQIHPLVIAELAVSHVAMVSNDLSHVLRRHILLLCLHKSELPLLAVPLALQLLPLPSCGAGNHTVGHILINAHPPFSCSLSSESEVAGGKGCRCRSRSGWWKVIP